MEKREELLNYGSIVAICAVLDSFLDKGRLPCSVAYMNFACGKVTGGPIYYCMSERIFLSLSFQ